MSGFVIRDMAFGNSLGAPETRRNRFKWHGVDEWCESAPYHGAELKPGSIVLQRLYQVVDLPPTGVGSIVTYGEPTLDEDNDRYTRTVTMSGPVAVPASITPLQARLALAGAGLLAAVESWVASDETGELYLWWQYATSIERNHPKIEAGRIALGVDAATMDALFIAGEALS